MSKSIDITLTGKLYKSGFRFYILEKGVSLGIKGYVKYLNKVDIFVHAEGPEAVLKEFIQWCEKGLLSCKVESIDVSEAEFGNYTHFDIQQN